MEKHEETMIPDLTWYLGFPIVDPCGFENSASQHHMFDLCFSVTMKDKIQAILLATVCVYNMRNYGQKCTDTLHICISNSVRLSCNLKWLVVEPPL